MEAQASQTSAHHFWALFLGPRHKFYAAALPKGYRVGKGICDPKNQVLVACYFLQPYFIDLAIWIRHFPKIATFLTSERLTVLNSHTLKTHGGQIPKFRAPLLGHFSGSPSQVLCGRLAERLPGW